ncbi:unnamed protein product [Vitrella brassicaformis CCMP3155]|uniref:adenosine deaminase n=1 Tax=Vitrella brassicaformis (strain CCMP3155) TaxID=1169540 RepID=A0A0G4FYG4_VITBC|nr:unnamed protein product [Vitrella brassicaformis CCMP3155]|eukprot:CEM20055.1 unnamed protein product [Vitrella brassicaformis CCMP3155]
MDQWKALPKVELHCHLEGAVRLSTILHYWHKYGLQTEDHEADLKDYFQPSRPLPNLSAFLSVFGRSQVLYREAEFFRRIAYEVCEDKARDGVQLLELRYAPAHCSPDPPPASLPHPLSYDEVLGAVAEGIREAEKKFDIEVGLICLAVSTLGADSVKKTAEFAAIHRDMFCGLDVAGSEDDLEWCWPLVKGVGLPLTVHCGQDICSRAAMEGRAKDNVRFAVEQMGATRIGHGVLVGRDEAMVEWLNERDVLLELSVTSNVFTGAVKSVEAHPLPFFLSKGLRVCVNTDDPGVTGSGIAEEYAMLNARLGISEADFLLTSIDALRGSFLPDDRKVRVRERLDCALAAARG